jgi:hypothetical protein
MTDLRATARAALERAYGPPFTPAALPEPTPVTTDRWRLAPAVRWWLAQPSDPWVASFYLVSR